VEPLRQEPEAPEFVRDLRPAPGWSRGSQVAGLSFIIKPADHGISLPASPQSGPALFTSVSEEIVPEMAVARGASPVKEGITDKRGHARDLRAEKLAF